MMKLKFAGLSLVATLPFGITFLPCPIFLGPAGAQIASAESLNLNGISGIGAVDLIFTLSCRRS